MNRTTLGIISAIALAFMVGYAVHRPSAAVERVVIDRPATTVERATTEPLRPADDPTVTFDRRIEPFVPSRNMPGQTGDLVLQDAMGMGDGTTMNGSNMARRQSDGLMGDGSMMGQGAMGSNGSMMGHGGMGSGMGSMGGGSFLWSILRSLFGRGGMM